VNIRLHNLHKHNGKSKDESCNTQSPRRSKDRPERRLERIDSPNNSRTSTLNRLVKPSEVGQFSGFIGQCTHEPVGVRLPCCIEEPVEHVQEEVCGVSRIEDVLLRRWDVSSGVLFEGIPSAPDDIDKDEEEDPAGDTSCATGEPAPVEENTEAEGTEDLSKPAQVSRGYRKVEYQ